MKLRFIQPKVREGKKYKGIISRYDIDKRRGILRLYVVLDKEPSLEFMKRLDIDLNINSNFALFCSNMQIFTEEDEVELEELVDTRVIACLRRGRDDMLYIDRCVLDEEYYSTQEDME